MAAVYVPDGPEYKLTVNQVRGALRQVMDSKEFNAFNTHLTVNERNNLNATPIVWPADKPVFHPYAVTHGGYGQVRYKTSSLSTGTKIYVHRLAILYSGRPQPFASAECSHLMSGFRGCGRDFNPNNLTWETSELNKSRYFCPLYFVAQTGIHAAANALQPVGHAQNHVAAVAATDLACGIVHAVHCKHYDPAWPAVSNRVSQ
jgi:hypothetical protein